MRTVFLLVLAAVLNVSAQACTCAMDPNAVVSPDVSSAHHDIVFVGTVQAGWLDWLWPMFAAKWPREVVLSVDEAFTGPMPVGRTIVVDTAWTGPECGYPFRNGETYLVYAHQPAGLRYPFASACSRTAAAGSAARDLTAWRQWVKSRRASATR